MSRKRTGMTSEEIERALSESKLAQLTRLTDAMFQREPCSYCLTRTEFMELESYAYAYQKGRLWVMPVWITELTTEFVGVTPVKGHGPLSQIKVPLRDASSIVTTELQ